MARNSVPWELPRLTDSTKAKRTRKAKPAAPVRPAEVGEGGFWFAAPSPAVATLPVKASSEPKTKTPKPKNDPRLVAAARELRDRWLDEVNATPLLPTAKYDVSRAIEGAVRVEVIERKRLAA